LELSLNQTPRFLILRPDRLGDVVLSTPLPREIKKKFPNAFIAVLVRNYTKAIYLNNPHVDEILVEEELGNSFYAKVKKIRSFKFSQAISLLPTKKNNQLIFWAGIRRRIGVGHKLYQFLTNAKTVYRRKYIPLKSEADYCLDSLRKIGVQEPSTAVKIHLSKEEEQKKVELRNKFAANSEIVVGIHATSGNSAPNLSLGEYKKLAELLTKENRIKIFLTEKSAPEELKNIDGVSYYFEELSLRETIVAFSALDILISASTGPMHIAAALKVKTLSVFCPLPACEPKLWGPQGNQAYFVMPDESYCANQCPGDPRLCKFEGVGGINAEKVYRHLKEVLPID